MKIPRTSKTGTGVDDSYQSRYKSGRKSNVVAVYDYCDERRKLLFQVIRFEPKSFRQRRPDGRGGWIYNMKGVRRVLYRLPELLESARTDATVYIVEGEKDADALFSQDLIATCNPMGAGKWRDEYSELLRGRNVVVIPDNDEPGSQHARQVVRSLWGKAKSIKIVNLAEVDSNAK
jgi:hypothetical protein